jgi:zinc transport system substrate-binding protein
LDGKVLAGIAGAVIAAAIIIGLAALPRQGQQPAASQEMKVKVIASFFPLYDFASHVGGDRAEVSTMIPAGIEPHDWEPTPRDIADVEGADLIVYNGAGFESWVAEVNVNLAVDTSERLDMGSENQGSVQDPHTWLDPINAKMQVEAIRDGLIQADPENEEGYRQNAARYLEELDSLDALVRSELADCERKDFIAFHSAFSYFANRYNLTQHSVHEGVSPEGDVLPQRIQQIKELAAELELDVIYAEELVDPRLAEVIAEEIPNGRVLVLSPIEGLEQQEFERGLGYLDKMKENVENLKVGLKCN